MNLQDVRLVTDVIAPAAAELSKLVGEIFDGTKSIVTARAQLRSVLMTATQRLDAADKIFAEHDAANDARLKK